jgi:asparagine synthase (glutamine-hydrolysing)
MAMAHSVEGRYPFLDHRVVEFAARLPATLKMKVLDEKHLLKLAALGVVPERIRTRHKRPYRAPDGVSFFGPAAGYARELLSRERIADNGVFDAPAVSALVGKFTHGGPTSTRDNMALVGVLSTQLLLDAFIHRRGEFQVSHDHPRPSTVVQRLSA